MLNNIVKIDRMSSLEIARLTGKRHKNVLRDIRSMLDELEIPRLRFELTSTIKGLGDNPDRPMLEGAS